ncbi:hypothetical protein C1646_56106 [Rhizophagus diaphanus]|nr:hypothetical protein C1646_56106 [Rhizophagus diaphanus] [Rhizophagus sp. MUCL 43196]
MYLFGRSTCEKQDIKHVEVCGSSANFPAKNLRFKVHDKSDDEIFVIQIAWQTSVEDAIPTIREEMARRNIDVPNNIKLRVEDPRGPEKELEPGDKISKHFNIDHIEEGLILIYPQ